LGAAGVGRDRAGVADLATGLCVEGRAVEHDRDRVAVAWHHRDDGGLRLELLAADELGGSEPVEYRLEVGEIPVQRGLARLATADLPGPAQRGVVAVGVDVDAALRSDLPSHLQREAVRLVEVEGDVTGEGVARP